MKYLENDKRKERQNIVFKKGTQECLVCGRLEDWKCGVREDEKLGLCSYVISDKIDKQGRYIHFFNSLDSLVNVEKGEKDIERNVQKSSAADSEIRDRIYKCFLSSLYLDEKHRLDLLGRGLSIEVIEANQYATVPNYESRYSTIASLAQQMDLSDIPGFYLDDKQWCLHMTFPGFYIPYRDAQGNIVALQIRRDDPADQKYLWLSSSSKEKGASSGTPLHFVNPNIVEETGTVMITEGALKADIIGAKAEVGLIATAGVNATNPKELSKSLYAAFPDVERILVAYDIDWQENENVRNALIKLLEELKDSVVKVYVSTWNPELGKGLDDVLINDAYQRVMLNMF